MGIAVEFNPDLALRAYGTPERQPSECLPKQLKPGAVYSFYKQGQRLYWFGGELPLLETKGNAVLSRPLASIKILEASHLRDGDQLVTMGFYQVIEVFDTDSPEIHFESYKRRSQEPSDG
jgi:hypothetical protein